MRDIRGHGLYADVVEAPSPEDPTKVVRLGIRTETFRRYIGRGLRTAIAQYYGIVQEGMKFTRHLFKGLNRPLMVGEDMNADESALVYTWRSSVDFEWHGSSLDGYPIERVPPLRIVFAVVVKQEEPNELGSYGSIERWNWIREDPRSSEAPIGWNQRYGSKLWSR
jgi:hypothetical protein